MENERKTIFLVDDNITNLTVGKNALKEKYNVFTIPSGEKMLMMLDRTIPDLILLDVEMPEMSGYDTIKIIKARQNTAHIPVIFLTAKTDAVSELEGLSLGAIDYITKPFSPPLLLKRIEVHLLVEQQKNELKNYNENLQEMVKVKTQTVVELQNSILQTVTELVEYRDNITGEHIGKMQSYLQILIGAMLEQDEYRDEISLWGQDFLVQSAQLHDVGKIAIKDCILRKPAKLTVEEFEEIKTHTTFGVKIIEKIQATAKDKTFFDHAKIFAGSHHEKWDGSGYPSGLSGTNIPLQGRIMAIVDVYDALTNERPYKKAFSHENAVEIILAGRGTHFDPTLVDIFIENEQDFKKVLTDLD